MIKIEELTVEYDNKVIFDHYELEIPKGNTVCIMGESGIGKSTLLKVLMGLVKPEHGTVTGMKDLRLSAVFQEDRLCEQLSAVKNVMMVLDGKHKRELAREHLLELLPKEDIEKKVLYLSGGMKRRVSIARAFAYPSDLIVMDEPFTGLDEFNKQKAIEYMIKHKQNRTLILVTHEKKDADALLANQYVRIGEQV